MGKLDRFSSIFWLLIAILICFYSYRIGIGVVNDPGIGFVFFYSGIFIGIISIMVFVRSYSKSQASTSKIFENVNWVKIILVLSYILGFALFLEKLGFIISTFLLIGLLLITIESKSLYIVILVALAASLVSYALFELWLHVRLPKGILGI